MDEEGEIELPIKNGKHIKTNYVGNHLKNYDSIKKYGRKPYSKLWFYVDAISF